MPGGGGDVVEQAVATAALRRTGERGRLAVDRGEVGAGGRARGLGGIARRDRVAFVGFRLPERMTRRGGLLDCRQTRGGGSVALGLDRGGIAERGARCAELRRVACRTIGARTGGGERGGGDARLGDVARMTRHRLRERDLGIARAPFRLDLRGVERGHRSGCLRDRGVERGRLVGEPRERIGGIARETALARAVLRDPAACVGKPGQLPVDRGAFGPQARERVPRLGGGVARGECCAARGGDRRDRVEPVRGGSPLDRRGVGHARIGDRRGQTRGIRGGRGLVPAREDQPGFGDADLRGKLTIAVGGARLAPERGDARVLVGDHRVEPGEIGLGRAQPGLGVLAADVQPGDPRRILEHRAAIGGFGGDHRADPALADQRGAVRARRGIGEEQPDILRADVAAVDPVGGARAAFDPADHLAFVDSRRPGDLREDRDLGKIARRARRGAGEDDVLHPRSAQRLGARLAHRPAERLEQVRLAAAVRPDDAGQPGFDPEVGGFDEALEPGDAEAFDLHGARSPLGWRR